MHSGEALFEDLGESLAMGETGLVEARFDMATIGASRNAEIVCVAAHG